MECDSKLIPVLREGIEIVKMIFFRDLQKVLGIKFPERDDLYRNKLAGAVINRYFGLVNPDQGFQHFANQQEEVIEDVLRNAACDLSTLRIPLTDALRTMVLCDHQDGVENTEVLAKAQEYGILMVERDLPMPNRFVELVRRLGKSGGMVSEPLSQEPPNTASNSEKIHSK